MKAKLMLGMIATTLGLSGCEKPPEDRLVMVRGQAYLIPWQDLPTIDPPNHPKDEILVRISRKKIPTGEEVDFLFNPDPHNIEISNGFPTLFGLGGDTKAEYMKKLNQFEIDGMNVFCKKPYGEFSIYQKCGFRLLDEKASWSINFSSKNIDNFSEIKSEAQKILKSYREAANAKQR